MGRSLFSPHSQRVMPFCDLLKPTRFNVIPMMPLSPGYRVHGVVGRWDDEFNHGEMTHASSALFRSRRRDGALPKKNLLLR